MSIKVDSVLVHRGLILANLKALDNLVTNTEEMIKEETYPTAYLAGYRNALRDFATMVQVEEEFDEYRTSRNLSHLNGMFKLNGGQNGD